MTFSHTRIEGRTHRLIASRFPTIGVFDDIAATEEELRVAFLLEDLTNLRSHARLDALPTGSAVHGPTGSLVMAAFLHCAPDGGRFSNGDLGAWYAATDVRTAIAETIYHHERRLRASASGFPARIQMRELVARLNGELLDLRGAAKSRPDLFHHTDYSASQAFARARRWPYAEAGEDGFAFDSVRREGGVNVVVFRPAALRLPVGQGDHYEYVWDAEGVLTVLKLSLVKR